METLRIVLLNIAIVVLLKATISMLAVDVEAEHDGVIATGLLAESR